MADVRTTTTTSTSSKRRSHTTRSTDGGKPSTARALSARYRFDPAEPGVPISVYARIRPVLPDEEKSDPAVITRANPDGKSVDLTNRMGTRTKEENHVFDRVFDTESTQEEVYGTVLAPIVKEVCGGAHGAVFAYGQTGTGKTFTSLGAIGNPVRKGLIPRALDDIWARMAAGGVSEYKVTVSMVQIYNEEMEDMFMPAGMGETKLRLMEDPRRGCFCQGLYELEVKTVENVIALLRQADKRTKTAETKKNEISSRSSRVFMLHLQFRDAEGGYHQGRLDVVDMAGSESAADATLDAKQRQELKNMNRSTLTFGRVLQTLADKTRGETRVPYRDSKLTRLMEDALGGPCTTAIIGTMSPSVLSEDETQNTIRYLDLARRVLNIPQVDMRQQMARLLDEQRGSYEGRITAEQSRYNSLEDKLNLVRLMRDKLLAAHYTTETRLGDSASAQADELERAAADVETLTKELEARRAAESATASSVSSFRSSVTSKIDILRSNVEAFHSAQRTPFSSIQEDVAAIADTRSKEVMELTAELENISSKVSMANIKSAAMVNSHDRESKVAHEIMADSVKARARAGETEHREVLKIIERRVIEWQDALDRMSDRMARWEADVEARLKAAEKRNNDSYATLEKQVRELEEWVESQSAGVTSAVATHDERMDTMVQQTTVERRTRAADLIEALQDAVRDTVGRGARRDIEVLERLQSRVPTLKVSTDKIKDGVVDKSDALAEEGDKYLEDRGESKDEAEERTGKQFADTLDKIKDLQDALNDAHKDAEGRVKELGDADDEATKEQADRIEDARKKHNDDTGDILEKVVQNSEDAKDSVAEITDKTDPSHTGVDELVDALKDASKRNDDSVGKSLGNADDDVDAIKDDVDHYVDKDFVRDTEPPLKKGEYPFPSTFPTTAPYSDILSKVKAPWTWREEVDESNERGHGVLTALEPDEAGVVDADGEGDAFFTLGEVTPAVAPAGGGGGGGGGGGAAASGDEGDADDDDGGSGGGGDAGSGGASEGEDGEEEEVTATGDDVLADA